MKIKIWEIALLIAIMFSVLVGTVSASQTELSENLIRLHVVANSNSDEDQSLKLAVRDGVLYKLSVLLDGCTEKSAAEKLIEDNKASLIAAANDVAKEWGKDYPISATIMTETFPTVEYETFSLPAGEYTSLRISIGSGAGHNWWCVIFPPLCLTAAESYKSMGLSDETFKIISEYSEGYVIKFKILEWLYSLRLLVTQTEDPYISAY